MVTPQRFQLRRQLSITLGTSPLPPPSCPNMPPSLPSPDVGARSAVPPAPAAGGHAAAHRRVTLSHSTLERGDPNGQESEGKFGWPGVIVPSTPDPRRPHSLTLLTRQDAGRQGAEPQETDNGGVPHAGHHSSLL